MIARHPEFDDPHGLHLQLVWGRSLQSTVVRLFEVSRPLFHSPSFLKRTVMNLRT